MKVLNEVDGGEWRNIIARCPEATFFATPEWAEIVNKTYSYEIATRLFIFEDGQKILLPMMRMKGGRRFRLFRVYSYLSVPFHNYGGLFSAQPISMDKIEQILNYLKKTFPSVTICPHPLSPVSYPEHYKGQEYSTHILDLTGGFDEFWQKYQDRDQARKAKKANIQILMAKDLEDYQKYYEMYLDSAKRWGLTQPHPWALYENLYLKSNDYIKLWLAKLDNQVLAGIILGYFNQNVVYWGAAFYYEFQQYRPNNLLHIEAIKDACKRGYKIYDFLPSGGNKGVEKFKESFGTNKIYFNAIEIIRK